MARSRSSDMAAISDEWYDTYGPRRAQVKPLNVGPDVKGVDTADVRFQPAPPMPQRPTKARVVRRKIAKRVNNQRDDNGDIGLNALMVVFFVLMAALFGFAVVVGIVAAFTYWPWWAACLTFAPFLAYGGIFGFLKWTATYEEDAVDRAFYH